MAAVDFSDSMDLEESFDEADTDFKLSGGRLSKMSDVSTNSLFSKAAISQRIVSVEHYMAAPVKEFDNVYSDFRSSAVKRVPVIRIFGPTAAGQKMCANIHGVYPYISIMDDGTVENLEYRIATALDNAINDSVTTNRYNKDPIAHNNTQHVFTVVRVSGKTFYGYRSDKEVFLRIFFYNPMVIKKAVDLLQSGSILGRRFQPYEAHISYSLQFMIDYSLYGMNFAHYASVKFRRKVKTSSDPDFSSVDDLLPSSQGSNCSSASSISSFIDPDSLPTTMLSPPQLTKSTFCELEIDVLASDILPDTNSSGKAKSENPGIDCIWKDEIERRRLRGVENCSQISIPSSQDRSELQLVHQTEDKYLQILWGKVQSYFDDHSIRDESQDNMSSSCFLETSYSSIVDDTENLPSSSEIQDHTSQEIANKTFSEEDCILTQEEEKFVKLLEEMAASSEDEEESREKPERSNLSDDIDDVPNLEEGTDGQLNDDGESNENDEDIWNDSFLSSSMLEMICEETENSECKNAPKPETSERENQEEESDDECDDRSQMIFQCDGQVNNSSDDSEEEKVKEVKKRGRPRKKEKQTANTLKALVSSTIKSKNQKTEEKKDLGKQQPNKVEKVDKNSGNKDSKTKSSTASSTSLSNSHTTGRLSMSNRRLARQDAHHSSASSFSSSEEGAKGITTRSKTPQKVSPSKTSSTVNTNVEAIKKEMPKLPVVFTKRSTRKSGVIVSSEQPLRTESKCAEETETKTVSKTNDNKGQQSAQKCVKVQSEEQKKLLENKEVVIRLEKLKDEATSSTKRQRRKPKRYIDEENGLTPDSTSSQPDTSATGRRLSCASDQSSHVSATSSTTQLKDNETEAQKKQSKRLSLPIVRKSGRNSTVDNKESMKSENDEDVANKTEQKVDHSEHSLTDDPESKSMQLDGHSSERLPNETNESSEYKAENVAERGVPQQLPIARKSRVRLGMRGLKQTTKVVDSVSSKSVDGDKKPSVKESEPATDVVTPAFELKLVKETEDQVGTLSSSPKPDDIPKPKKVHTETLCKPSMIAQTTQTNVVLQSDNSMQAQPQSISRHTQYFFLTHDEETQTRKVQTKSISVQTETIPSLCLCQCTCVRKGMAETGTDAQEEFKPVMKQKQVQVDSSDMYTRARQQARFTTPQGNKIKNTTPSRSPEKRRTLTDSPKRRGVSLGGMLMSNSKFLNALVMKTPTSTHKYRASLREGPSTPTSTLTPEISDTVELRMKKTPPSKEEYLINMLKATTSPRNNMRRHSVTIKPRNLLVENQVNDEDQESDELLEVAQIVNDRVTTSSTTFTADADQINAMSTDSSDAIDAALVDGQPMLNGSVVEDDDKDMPNIDLSVNSVYEYEEGDSSVVATPLPPLVPVNEAPPVNNNLNNLCPPASFSDSEQQSQEGKVVNEEPEDHNNDMSISLTPLPASQSFGFPIPEGLSPMSMTSFQKKRQMSRNRSRVRLERRKLATLDANRDIPDVFFTEYEPLKQPPSYKSMAKWLEGERQRNPTGKLLNNRSINGEEDSSNNDVDFLNGDNSSDEELPAPVKLFGGGGKGHLSDEEEDSENEDGTSSNTVENNERSNEIKPFTPPPAINFEDSILGSGTNNGVTPRSILRQRNASSKRQGGVVQKRKIRWDDEEDDCNGSNGGGSQKRIKLEEAYSEDSVVHSSNESFTNKTIDQSELDGPTLKNALGLETSMSNYQDVKALQQCQFVTTMCIEVHCASRNGLTPDPAIDPILAIFLLVSSDYPENFRRPKECMNILILDQDSVNISRSGSPHIKTFSSESDMINAFIGLVRYWDPDIFVGYEVEKFSFGYLIQRGFHLDKDMVQELSRVLPIVRKEGDKKFYYKRNNEEWNGTISGRIVLNLWRLLRHEITVNSYTFENSAYHILRRRVYKLSYELLHSYWNEKMYRIKVIQYYTIRIRGVFQIMEKLDLINRTSELARLFGIQFYEVLSRGSQFRVESMMLRAAKPLDYVAPSPTVLQRAKMRAPEFLPLILEPKSNYYTEPVAVLDFQSLYPSMMIAYNYDYASLIGRVEHLGTLERFPVGCLDHHITPNELLRLKDHIHVSPAGVAFLDKSIVKGVVPEMLEQILDTRQMVKRAMKKWKNEGASLHKVLDSRQLGLKLIANVTYGYTSANFSGRMPCVDIADSIVSKGRETLQRAIDLVKANFHRWGGEVVYGDTDSMFVMFRGKSRDEAFKLAYEIADEVTQANPKPVKLKFEKIYQPCILQTKKRYVGYAYETPDQEKPIYDAKGIETVRRDGCPAVRKILERTLHTLFTTNKPSKVEEYVKFQCEKLFKGRVSMQDYIFARKFRGRSGYKPKASVPALEIAKKLTEIDPRAEPLTSERVPYVVIYGDPNLPLIKLVRRPEEYLKDPSLRLNAHYYIEKVIIPALNRCLKLANMDASKWYLQMPRKYLRNILEQKPGGQKTLDNYMLHKNCLRCDGKAEEGSLCKTCLEDEVGSVIHLQGIVKTSKLKLSSCLEICTNCAGEANKCISLDCPILHKLTRYQRDQVQMNIIQQELKNLDW